ncbi:MAG: septum formation inhibitor Maf [Clostridiales bacterium]|jgi:septum formation protein|nr:septum formation inhibitor Maf [Clostridiales bacterium]
MRRIVLASASPRRSDLLRQIGLAFDVIESGVDEDKVKESDPKFLAGQLALRKAKSVAGTVSNGIIIAADTVVCVDGRLLGKPEDADEAAAMLRSLSGRSHDVMTGLAIIAQPEGRIETHVECTTVHMRCILPQEIDWYVASGEPFDKAGGYGIQGKAAVFVERLDGCYYNVVGLPLTALWRMFGSLGIRIWEGAGIYDITAPNHQGPASK